MCGIVGLFLKDRALEPDLGRHLTAMLASMTDRGPDSAGFAVYGPEVAGDVKLTVRGPAGSDFAGLAATLSETVGTEVGIKRRFGTHAVLAFDASATAAVRAALQRRRDVSVVSEGARMEVFKEVGLPAQVARSFGLDQMNGSHGVGHTRMATESAVTTAGAHPFSTGRDQCLVHNGSLSNHNDVRRRLRREGVSIETDNDSEVAAGYLTWRMNGGDSLGGALDHALQDLDGFYTFVVGTQTGFGVLRDPVACKPAVLAETDGYVAFGSEYRALVDLPDIQHATVWEPKPATVYFWEREA